MKPNLPKICIPVCVHRAKELPSAIARAAEVADIVELRLDCLEDNEREEALTFLRHDLNRAGTPVILTLRSPEQGGHTTSDFGARRHFWASLIELSSNALIDLELDLVLSFMANEQVVHRRWIGVG